ncbi:MAG TPA: rhodanese-like domain-containing protein [Ramlibacter sp.]|jgi:UPF0176 protein
MPPAPPALVHSAFYRFTPVPDPLHVAALLRELLARAPLGTLGGSILLATEGINGTVAGPLDAVDAFEQLLQHHPLLAPMFAGIRPRRTACTTPPFARMKVHVRREVVQLGVAGVDARATGTDVHPRDWRALMREPDVVLLDNRNSFEFRLGHFEGAIDPQAENFRDFPAYVRAHAAEWKAQGKRIAMYCTGGIRCEKTSAWMRELALPVFQLQGGILGYFAEVEDADRDFHGECFVFDNRVALDTRLRETSTTLEGVYGDAPGDAWRLQRARRLAAAT